MKKLLLIALALGFTACEQDECFGKAEVITPSTFPRSIVVEKMPKRCDDGTPDMEEFNKKYGNSYFVKWL